MNEKWITKVRKKIASLKEDPKAAKSLSLLKWCAVDALAYIIIAELNIPGFVGLFLRFACFLGLMIILFIIYLS